MAPSLPEKKFDWVAAKRCLAEIHEHAPKLLQQAVIIGGMACWFYRELLERAASADFRNASLDPAQEALWLSKDLDFTNFFIEDARHLLGRYLVKDQDGVPRIVISGVPIGFAQIGITLDPEAAWLESWVGSFEGPRGEVEFRVVDPISLYREKQALVQKRGSRSDRLHLALLSKFLQYEVCRQADAVAGSNSLGEKTQSIEFLAAVRDRASEVCADIRVQRRLRTVLGSHSFAGSEQKLIQSLLVAND